MILKNKPIYWTIVFLCLITSVSFESCYSQNSTITIKGKVSTMEPDCWQNIPVYLKLNDSVFVWQKTNQDGEYSFTITPTTKTLVLSVEEIKKVPDGKKENCGYLSCHKTQTITITNEKTYQTDFFVHSRTYCEVPSPIILFKFNSLAMAKNKNIVPFTDLPGDSAINAILPLLRDNPTIIIQLTGHCDSREKNPDNLSLLRAKFVADKLIEKGIPKERILTSGKGSTRNLVRQEEIDKFEKASKQEKENLHQKNRRVVVEIASYDYKKK